MTFVLSSVVLKLIVYNRKDVIKDNMNYPILIILIISVCAHFSELHKVCMTFIKEFSSRKVKWFRSWLLTTDSAFTLQKILENKRI